mmetsp:Transcript_23630/g.56969  ORF Transcript_23630/g.56969 Transcript_23630/m.56969 type:complete len:231 (+) Transcript_23630:95-787(+)
MFKHPCIIVCSGTPRDLRERNTKFASEHHTPAACKDASISALERSRAVLAIALSMVVNASRILCVCSSASREVLRNAKRERARGAWYCRPPTACAWCAMMRMCESGSPSGATKDLCHISISFSCSLMVGSYTMITPCVSRRIAVQQLSYLRSPEQSHSSTCMLMLVLPALAISSNSRIRVPAVGLYTSKLGFSSNRERKLAILVLPHRFGPSTSTFPRCLSIAASLGGGW